MNTTQEMVQLRQALDETVKKYRARGCEVSVIAQNSEGTVSYSFGQNDVFHPASIIKLYVSALLMDLYDRDLWNPSNIYNFTTADYIGSASIIAGAGITSLSGWQLIYFMLAHSDNSALFILVQGLSQEHFDTFCAHYKLNSTKALFHKNGSITEMETSVSDMIQIWHVVSLLSESGREFILNACSQTPYTYLGLRYLPTKLTVANAPIVKYATKHGKLDTSVLETLLLNYRGEELYIAIAIRNVPGNTFRNNTENEGILMLADLTKKSFEFLTGDEFPIHSDFYNHSL